MHEPFTLGSGKTALLLIHGFTGAPSSYLPLAQDLAAKGYTCEGILLAGHATTEEDMEKNGNWRVWLRQCRDAVIRLKMTHPHVYVIGHSMGALLALILAEEGLVDGVCALAAPLLFKAAKKMRWAGLGWRFVHFLDWSKIAPTFGKAESKGTETEAEALYRKELETEAEALYRKELETYHYTYPRVPVKCVTDLCRLSDMANSNLSLLRCPLLAVQGDRDEMVPMESVQILEEGAPSVFKRVHVLEGATHMLLLGKSRPAVTAHVLDFLTEAEQLRLDAESSKATL